jgi:hypothetical protein
MSRVYGERAERWGIEMSQEKARHRSANSGSARVGFGNKFAELKTQIRSGKVSTTIVALKIRLGSWA